jgi:non-specific serine/threonine protein kinase
MAMIRQPENFPETVKEVRRQLALSLSPAGHLTCRPELDAPPLPLGMAQDLLKAFDRGAGYGLLLLATARTEAPWPPLWAYWRAFALRFLTMRCTTPEEDGVALPGPQTLSALVVDAPPMTGAEYLSPELLAELWQACNAALAEEKSAAGQSLQEFLKARNPAWNLVGRVHFNLAENRKDPDAPFAFLATYTTRLSALGKAQHLPLSQALAEFSGGRQKPQLLSLLLPVQRASQACPWIASLLDSGEIFHPLRWQVADVLNFLNDLAKIEAAGIVVRMPAQWQSGRPARPKVKATLGKGVPSKLGMEALLDFHLEVSLEGEPLSEQEIQAVLAGEDGLHWLRGRWVEVDRSLLARTLDRFRAVEASAREGLPLADALRLLAGASLSAVGGESAREAAAAEADWAEIGAGPWLGETLRGLRAPEGLASVEPGPEFAATLRPYQQAGLRWLFLLTRLGLGACLADDMGLGKTIQVLALLVVLKREEKQHRPSLLVVPASLLANWLQETTRFAPGLRCLIAHPSAMPREELQALDEGGLAHVDLLITSYGTLPRLEKLAKLSWRLAIVDEAQAIKNPGTRQTKQVKQLRAEARIALTGTPVENRLSDLWSIFDFTHPGLLGSQRDFAEFSKRLSSTGHYGPLRGLVAPYILRRLKSDKRIIADLPDKTELTAWCALTATQAAHYQRAVLELAKALEHSEGIERKGLVLAYLMRFKQICNHPSQWLKDGDWQAEGSGKFARLREIAETIAARQEKLLVFTQFQETTAPLTTFLGGVFGREGLLLHGGTPVARRRELVARFQEDERLPFFVLSLKAGGAGLNLTSASHVVHFDRWWNPAVENQATDRAYRIGQHRNVLVHKFVCRGTIEERIDDLIRAKGRLVADVVEGAGEINLTEMSDGELLDLVRLDIHAMEEAP